MAAKIALLAIQLGIIIIMSRFCGRLAEKVKIPSVLGELLSGIIIGPYVIGGIHLPVEFLQNGLFPLQEGSAIPVSESLYSIATLGSIVLLFMSGLETDLKMFFRYSVAGTLVGLGGVVFSFGLGDMLGMILIDGNSGFMDPRCLFLGILSTATSVGITARILSEKKTIDSPEGTTILAAAVIDDVLGIICLAVVMGLVVSSGSSEGTEWAKIGMIAAKCIFIWLGFTALGIIFSHQIAKFLKCFRPAATFSMLAFAFALILAGVFEQFGLAMIVGAYVMGLALSGTDIAFSIQRALHGVYDFIVPVFFVVMGMLVDVKVFAEPDVLWFGILYSAIAIAAKIIGCALPALFMNFNMLGACRIGMGMIPRGEVALIIAGIGATTMMTVNGSAVPVINNDLFGVAVIMTLLTTLVAPPALSAVLSIKKRGVRHEVAVADTVRTVFPIPPVMVREFVIRNIIDNFRIEGFRHSSLDRELSLTTFRRNKSTFSLAVSGKEMCFESSQAEVVLIKTIVYETMVELNRLLGDLKSYAIPTAMDELIKDHEASASGKVTVPLSRIIAPDCVITNLKARTTEEAIKELLHSLDGAHRLVDREECEADVLSREASFSTAMENGVALPHARTAGVTELVAAVGISIDGCAGSHIFVLSLCPKRAERPYLQFIARIATIVAAEENRQAIMNSNSPAELREIFLGRKG